MTLPNGQPIKVQVEGPKDKVGPGQMFHYLVKVQDIDVKTPFNPNGVDPNVRVAFQISSMKRFEFQIAPVPDSDGNLLCFIRGLAQDMPGVYLDSFRGFNAVPGLVTWDLPAGAVHTVTIG